MEKRFLEGKTVGILTGGGDTPAVNSSIEQIRNHVSILGAKVYGIRKGWKGLLGEGDIVDLTNQPFDGKCGGSALKSSRTNPFPSKKNPESRVDQVLTNLDRYGIDILVTIGGDDTNGAAKKLWEQERIPVIGFPKTIDNDLRTTTIHGYKGKDIEVCLCPGFPSAANSVVEYTQKIRTTASSHSRVMVLEVMGRHAGWLTGTSSYGFADMALIPEFEIDKSRKEKFFEKLKEKYQENNYLIIAVSEGTRWYNDQTGQVEEVYASTETDEYGHPRLGGISGVIANEISQKLKIDARAQIIGYYARSGKCFDYDRKLTVALADKVLDLLLREDYGKMPVLKRIESFPYIEEYNTTAIDMGNIGNLPLPLDYYNPDEFEISEPYYDFLYHILGPIEKYEFKYKYPKVYPIK